MKNEPFNMFLFFKENVKMEDINAVIKMKYYDSNLDKNLVYEIPVSKLNSLQNDFVFKLGIFKIIKYLEEYQD